MAGILLSCLLTFIASDNTPINFNAFIELCLPYQKKCFPLFFCSVHIWSFLQFSIIRFLSIAKYLLYFIFNNNSISTQLKHLLQFCLYFKYLVSSRFFFAFFQVATDEMLVKTSITSNFCHFHGKELLNRFWH